MIAWIRSAFLDNLSFKLFALLLAIILFRKINQEDRIRVATVDIKLLYAFPTKNLLMMSEPTRSLKVTLQGPESKLTPVTTRPWQFTVKLSDAEPGPMQTELYTQEIRSIFPSEIQVTRIKPSILNVRFEKKSKRTLPVKLLFKGVSPFGYKLLKPITSFPRKVTLEGPEETLKKLREVSTQYIDLTGKRKDGPINIKLNHPGKFVRFLGTSTVRITLQFHVLKGSKRFEKLPIKLVHFSNPKLDYELKPETLNLLLFGPLAQLHPMKKQELIIEVDGSKVSAKNPGEHLVPLRIRIPAPEIKLFKPAPKSITVITRWKAGITPPTRTPDAGSSGQSSSLRKTLSKKKHLKKRKRKRRRRWRRKRRKRSKKKFRKRRKPKKRPKKKRSKKKRSKKKRSKKKRTKKKRPTRKRHKTRKHSKKRAKKKRAKKKKSPKSSMHKQHKRRRRLAKRTGRAQPTAKHPRKSKKSKKGRLLTRALRKLQHLPTARLPSVKTLLKTKKAAISPSKKTKRNKRNQPHKQ